MCGPDLKRKLSDNPQLYRYSLSKLHRNISPNQQQETSPIHITRRNSDTLSVIVEDTIISKTTTNNDDQFEIEKEEITTVKTENV